MRDFRDAKAMAQSLREALKAKSIALTHSESLDLIARTFGLHDWNVLAAAIQASQPLALEPEQPPAPREATRPCRSCRSATLSCFRRWFCRCS